MSPPRISVIISCFNLGAYLEEAVDSALSQSYSNIELLIADDGSPDAATQAVLERLDRPKTQVFRLPHRGVSAARNHALFQARGEFICALDADDRLHPLFFEKALDALDADPRLSFVSSWLEMFGDEQGLWRQERCDLPALLAEDTVHTAALVRTRAVREVGGYDEWPGLQGEEDWDLWISLAERGARGLILQEVLFYYRRRPGSLSTFTTQGEARLQRLRYLLAKHAASYQRHWEAVLVHWEEEIGAALRANRSVERDIQTWLEPRLTFQQLELQRLQRKLAAHPTAARGG